MDLQNYALEPPKQTSFDVGIDNFAEAVIERSRTVPVLVDFWAPWCEPCKTLTPVLESLAEQFAGAFELAKVNLDDNQHLAAQFQVRSIPTVYLIKDGNVIDGFMGGQPEQAIRQMLAKHIDTEGSAETDPIDDLIAMRRFDEAISALNRDDSDAARVRLAQVHLELGSISQAQELLDSVDSSEQSTPKFKEIAATLHFVQTAQSAPDPQQLQQNIDSDASDWNSRYQLAAILLVDHSFEAGMDQLLQIVKGDRTFNDDAGRRGLIMAFDMLHAHVELVGKFRRKLAIMLN